MAEEQPKKSSAVGTILGVVIATVLAIGAGAGGGIFMAQTLSASMEASMKPGGKKATKSGKHGATDEKHGRDDTHEKTDGDHGDDSGNRVTLAPIITNLAAPSKAWIRLEVSILHISESDSGMDELIKQIQEDILGFLRTLKLSQIEGPSGFQHMKEDLNERVKIRSNGSFGKLLVHALLVE
ncbi:MAG: flagellar basal body-associated FliL family protein [Hyphomicrobiaceae bacterium]